MAGRGSENWLRVGEADRDRCVDLLQTHFVAGRLEKWELEGRVEKALVARTQGELSELVADCQRATVPSGTGVKRAGAYVAALAAIVALAGATGAGAPSASADLSTCAATGVAVPDDVDCPVLTPEQERLMQDADRAAVAADQVLTMSGGTDDDARLRDLVVKSQAASENAQEAVSEAQLIVAAAPDGKIGKNSLHAAAKKARSAATDAARAAVEANTIASRGS